MLLSQFVWTVSQLSSPHPFKQRECAVDRAFYSLNALFVFRDWCIACTAFETAKGFYTTNNLHCVLLFERIHVLASIFYRCFLYDGGED